MTVASPAMRELELERDGLEWINPRRSSRTRSPTARRSRCTATWPRRCIRSARPGRAGRARCGSCCQWPRRSSRPCSRRCLRSARRCGSRWPCAATGSSGRDRLAGSAEALGLDLFEGDRRATAWLAGSAQHSVLPPTAAASGAFGLLLQLLGHSHGWPLPRGGMQSLTDALVRRAQREGATIRCGAAVEQVLVGGGRVKGVRLAGGEEIPAEALVSTVTAGLLARLLPAERCPDASTGDCGSGATEPRRSRSITRSPGRCPGPLPRRARPRSCTSPESSRS